MKNNYFFWIIILIGLSISSCRTTNNMKYLQDLNDNESKLGFPVKTPDYQIKPNDNLYVSLQSMNAEVSQLFGPSRSGNYSSGTQSDFGDVSSQYLNGYQVNQNGKILLPVLGEVLVNNLTEEEAKNTIQKKVDEFFKDATVKVKILTFKITILGEVRSPGVFHNYNKNITILEAIGMANGTTQYAGLRNVLVIRATPNGNRSFRLDLTGKKMMSSDAYYLQPNDVVYVEPDKYVNYSINTTGISIALAGISTTILILSYIND